MNELEKLLNEPVDSKPKETESPKQVKQPSAATIKVNALSAQEQTIAAASVGSSIFRSAKDFLADNPEIKKCQKETVSARAG